MTDDQCLDPKAKAEWLTALRGGEYTQGRGSLGDPVHGYCCLGVFCVANGIDFNADDTGHWSGPPELLDSIPEPLREQLWEMNDNGRTFREIADFIEERL